MISLKKPSEWIKHYIFKYRHKKTVLDLACGNGRHVYFMLKMGFKVSALDINIADISRYAHPKLSIIKNDLEASNTLWPFKNKQFDIIIVTNYLYRNIFPKIIHSLNNEGILLYETFAIGQEKFGKPKNTKYLLRKHELIKLTKNMDLLAFENITVENKKKYTIQRIAVKKLSI